MLLIISLTGVLVALAFTFSSAAFRRRCRVFVSNRQPFGVAAGYSSASTSFAIVTTIARNGSA
jgi:hypothetical protein